MESLRVESKRSMISKLFLNLRSSNPVIYGSLMLFLARSLISALLIVFTDQQVLGINAWIKPFKFWISSVIFVGSIALYLQHLENQRAVKIYSWVVALVLAFEVFYISIQASLGELSHFNDSSAFHHFMFSLMGIAISILTLWTLYIAYLFFKSPLKEMNPSMKWAIRIGLILFVIFAFEGGLMGAMMSHTVGGNDGGPGIPFFNWSILYGDLRIAHFVGMHALQVLPIAALFIKSKASIISLGMLYFILAIAVLYIALQGVPILS